ncbi:unnamed protein product [Ranitomeya imitator]|uniref:Ig-like domain-containing protein n=1 Tax=Ranitomeya imitator TaxID=111125 RepID=A0ABN9L8S4_9NEOB|nr:unnamed protein product [Ranitomeya imitator]
MYNGLYLLLSTVSSLELTGPSTNAARLGSDTWVPCLFTVDNPPVDLNHLTIFWYFLDKEILSYNKTVRTNSSRYSLSTEELVTGAANLTISNIRISDGGRYKCSVIYNSERREKRLWLDVGVPPQVTITDKTVVVNEESVLRCSATGFFPIDIEVKWFKGSERLSDVIVDQPQKNPDRTYSVNSTVTITPTEEDREQNFSCRVRHFHLTDPRQVHFQLIYEAGRSSARIITACSVPVVILVIIITGVLWWKLKPRRKAIGPFIVRDIVGPPKLIDGEEAVLCCTVDDAPEDLCATWLIRRAGQEQEIQTSQRREHSEEAESLLDTSYVIKSKVVGHQYSSPLSFIPHMERHKDVTFICRAVSGHHNDEKAFHCRMIYVKPKLSKSLTRRRVRPGEIKYLLNLEKFYPQNIKIVWMCGVETTGGVVSSTESKSENPDGTYNVFSEIVIPEDQHEDPGFRVRVTWEHESMEEPESRELNCCEFCGHKWYCSLWASSLRCFDIRVLQDTAVDMDIQALCSSMDNLVVNVQKIQDTIDQKSMLEPRIPIPDLFFGDRTKFLSFRNNCKLFLALKPHSSGNPIQQVLIIISFLRGDPQDWAFSLAPGDSALSNIDAFFQALGLLYDEPNSVDQAEKNLLALCQGQDDVELYCQKFRKWSVLTLWNESALAALFRKGLSEALKDVMVGFPMPAGLNESMSLAIQIGRRLRERKSVHHLAVLSESKPEPMQCNRTMTKVERHEHRRLNRLCFYCGDSTHAISNCPKRTRRFDSSAVIGTVQSKFLLSITLMCSLSSYSVMAFVDSGAALNLMDLDYAKRCGFFLEPLRCPIPLRGIDATPLAKNKPQYWAQLTMCMAPAHQEVIRFLVEVDASEIGAGAVLSQRAITLNIRDSGKPQMSAPIEITVADSFHVRYSLNLQKFYPKDIKISWCREDKSDKYVISAMETIHARDEDLTYEVISVVRISKYLFRDPEMKIIVEWKHERTETSERRSLSVRDLPWRPHVGSISVPMLEDGKAAALTCHISGYFPDLLSVNWFTKKDGNVTELPRTSANADVNYKFSNKEMIQADNTYSCKASVTFTPIISSHGGTEIVCRVEHPSEERPIERSTAPLHIGERIYG